jgi:uncharacterized protein (DUF2252 family)
MGTKRRHPTADQRGDILTWQRNLKMARSAHAYMRGNTTRFYEWLDERGGVLPEGPPVWICGDCHLGNLGPLANANGKVEIGIRDLDQTVIGNPAHDLLRLGLSLATAARGSDLPGITTANMLGEMVVGYANALESGASAEVNDPMPASVSEVIARSRGRQWKHLARERIEDASPKIPLGKRFWALTAEERSAIEELFQSSEMREMATSLSHRDASSIVTLRDAAYWMKGCSSLGRLRYAALVEVRHEERRSFALMDIKEATPAAAPRSSLPMPRNDAERVVTGARAIAPFLGKRMRAARMSGRQVVVRELMPQDLKLEIDRLSRAEAVTAARFLAAVVGRAHGRQMDDTVRRHWRGELDRRDSSKPDAPSWLWSGVVDLLAVHEPAYLEHCRHNMLLEAA